MFQTSLLSKFLLITTFSVLAACTQNSVNVDGEPTPSQDKPLEDTINPDPEKAARLNLELGMAYMEKQDYEKALKKLQKSIAIDPNYVDAHNAIAILYTGLKEDKQAEYHYLRALKINPDDSQSLNNFGQFLCRKKRYAKADEMFNRAISNPLYRTPEIALLNAGLCAKSGNNLDQAENYFRRALERNPNLAPALYQMSDLNFSQQRYVPARAYIQRYESVARHTAGSLWLALRIEGALGDVDAEASYGLKLKNNFPDSKETSLLYKREGK